MLGPVLCPGVYPRDYNENFAFQNFYCIFDVSGH